MSHEMFQDIADMFSTGETGPAERIFADDYLDHQKPEWLDIDGPDEFRSIVELARKSLPGLHVQMQGEVVATSFNTAARLLWISELGERETIEMLRLENGKAVEHWGAESWSRLTAD